VIVASTRKKCSFSKHLNIIPNFQNIPNEIYLKEKQFQMESPGTIGNFFQNPILAFHTKIRNQKTI
jgi:hypothetical protein